MKRGRIVNPGLSKLEAIAGAMGFPPQLWFGGGERESIQQGVGGRSGGRFGPYSERG
jgi:hypothetical protein